jgi:hypothetical protein
LWRINGRKTEMGMRTKSCATQKRFAVALVWGAFPDGNSALMLVCACLRYVSGTQWGNKKHMGMKYLEDASIAG